MAVLTGRGRLVRGDGRGEVTGGKGAVPRPGRPAVDDGRDAQVQPGLLLRRGGVEPGPHRWRHDADGRPGQVAADRRGGGRRGDQEQVGALGHPQPVHGHVGAQHHRRPGWRLRLERGRGRRPGGEHTEHQVGRLAGQIRPQRRHQPGPGAAVHQPGQPAPGPQVGEVQPVIDRGHRDQAAEHPVSHPGAPATQQGHGVQLARLPPGLAQQAGAAARHHLVAEPHRPGQQHCVRRSSLPARPCHDKRTYRQVTLGPERGFTAGGRFRNPGAYLRGDRIAAPP